MQWFAYPAGAHDARIASLVRRAGYVLAVTTQPGAVQSAQTPLELHRYEILDSTHVTRPRRAARRRAWVESARDGDDPHPPRRPAGSRRRGGSRSRPVGHALLSRWWLLLLGLVVGAIIGYLSTLGGAQTFRAQAVTYMGQPLGSGQSQVQALNTNPSSACTILTSEQVVRR